MVRRALRVAALMTALGASGAAQTSPGPTVPDSFDAVRSALSAASLSDSENGEILGTALDLIDRRDLPERQPAADPAHSVHRVGVVLAPGALDKLRRSSEFRPISPEDGTAWRATIVYLRDEAPAIRVIVTADTDRAIIEVSQRP